MNRKLLPLPLLLPLCLGFAIQALAEPNAVIVIVIQDTQLNDGSPSAISVRCGQSLQVYHRSGGNLYVTLSAPDRRSSRNWGWIDARLALPPSEAIRHFDAALQKNAKDTTAYLGRAAAEKALGQYDKVIADCSQALQLDSNSIWAFYLRAAAEIAKDHVDKAIADIDEVIRIAPDRADVYRTRADLWRMQ